MATIVVGGALANKPLNGGEAWVRLSWIRGLRTLGFDVLFVEQLAAGSCIDAAGRPAAFEDSLNRAYFEAVTEEFGLSGSAALLYDGGRATAGLPYGEVLERAEAALLLVNISGHLDLAPLMRRLSPKAYIDVDPGFTQIWTASGSPAARLDGHDYYFTVGENIGTRGCSIPTGGIRWRPLPPPVTLADWPVAPSHRPDRFTTVATWRSPLGELAYGGVTFTLKHHEWRKVMELPKRSPREFEIALDIHPAERGDIDALHAHGWRLSNPRHVARDPARFRRYVQGSAAEFSVAHGVYVGTASGWFSDRTVRYLASGKPALVQDTGFASSLRGEGVVPFRTLAEAVTGAEHIVRNYDAHSRAARALAEKRFDSNRVLGRFLEEVAVGS